MPAPRCLLATPYSSDTFCSSGQAYSSQILPDFDAWPCAADFSAFQICSDRTKPRMHASRAAPVKNTKTVKSRRVFSLHHPLLIIGKLHCSQTCRNMAAYSVAGTGTVPPRCAPATGIGRHQPATTTTTVAGVAHAAFRQKLPFDPCR